MRTYYVFNKHEEIIGYVREENELCALVVAAKAYGEYNVAYVKEVSK